MSTRFIDTMLLKNDFYRSLKKPAKDIWVYLILNVDLAGFIHLQFDDIRYQCEFDLTDTEILSIIKNDLGNRVAWAEGIQQNHIWIRGYFLFQKNFPLSPFNSVHRNIVKHLVNRVDRYRNDQYFKYVYKICCIEKFFSDTWSHIKFFDKEEAKSIVNTQRIYKQKYDLDNVPEIKLPDEDLISVPVSGSKKLTDLGKKD